MGVFRSACVSTSLFSAFFLSDLGDFDTSLRSDFGDFDSSCFRSFFGDFGASSFFSDFIPFSSFLSPLGVDSFFLSDFGLFVSFFSSATFGFGSSFFAGFVFFFSSSEELSPLEELSYVSLVHSDQALFQCYLLSKQSQEFSLPISFDTDTTLSTKLKPFLFRVVLDAVGFLGFVSSSLDSASELDSSSFFFLSLIF